MSPVPYPGKPPGRDEVQPGTALVGWYKNKRYEVQVVGGPAGEIRFRLVGREYTSLSSAAKSITGYNTNGWKFWRIEPPDA